MLPREYYLPVSDPIFKTDQLAVNIKAYEESMDGFIYDIITIGINDPRCVDSVKNAALLITNTIFRPQQSNEPLKRYEPLSLRKLAREGQLAKRKTYLG